MRRGITILEGTLISRRFQGCFDTVGAGRGTCGALDLHGCLLYPLARWNREWTRAATTAWKEYARSPPGRSGSPHQGVPKATDTVSEDGRTGNSWGRGENGHRRAPGAAAAAEAAVSPTELLLPNSPSGNEAYEMPEELIRVAQDVGCGSPEGLHSDLLRECSPREQNWLNPKHQLFGRTSEHGMASSTRVLPSHPGTLAKKSQDSGARRPFLPPFLPAFPSQASDEPWPARSPRLLNLSQAFPLVTTNL